MNPVCLDRDRSREDRLAVLSWPALQERLRCTSPWEWPAHVIPWLMELTAPITREGPTAQEDVDKLVDALVLVNALGRLHRTRTGSVQDAFRAVREVLFKALRQRLSPQEVCTLLDTIDFEARLLEQEVMAAVA